MSQNSEPLVAPDDRLDAEQLADSPGLSGFSCPDCGGRLWEIQDGGLLRFRCRVGHMYSADSLVDGKNAKRYLVARDSRGACLCTNNGSAIFIEAGQTSLLSAVFAIPPPDVTSISVQVPLFGVIDNVPVK